jgi:hypothetical protein
MRNNVELGMTCCGYQETCDGAYQLFGFHCDKNVFDAFPPWGKSILGRGLSVRLLTPFLLQF